MGCILCLGLPPVLLFSRSVDFSRPVARRPFGMSEATFSASAESVGESFVKVPCRTKGGGSNAQTELPVTTCSRLFGLTDGFGAEQLSTAEMLLVWILGVLMLSLSSDDLPGELGAVRTERWGEELFTCRGPSDDDL